MTRLALLAFVMAVALMWMEYAQAQPPTSTCEERLAGTAEYGSLLAQEQDRHQQMIAVLRAEKVILMRQNQALAKELEELKKKPKPEATP